MIGWYHPSGGGKLETSNGLALPARLRRRAFTAGDSTNWHVYRLNAVELPFK